jgi:hypothetical protein
MHLQKDSRQQIREDEGVDAFLKSRAKLEQFVVDHCRNIKRRRLTWAGVKVDCSPLRWDPGALLCSVKKLIKQCPYPGGYRGPNHQDPTSQRPPHGEAGSPPNLASGSHRPVAPGSPQIKAPGSHQI